MNLLIETMLRNRGYSHEFLRDINNPQYGKLDGIDEMAVRLNEIHSKGMPITIYPDFDMDGIAAGTLGFAGLAELGFVVNLYVPNAASGYGITRESIEDCLKRFPATKAILTCDTGIGAVEAADYCREHGVQFLVTDHHPQSVGLPADMVVDPMKVGEQYAHPQICGAFVLWQVLQRYADLYCNYFTQDQIRRLRVFAGIGTVSDSMPLLYENRQLVRDAVAICQMVYGAGEPMTVSSIPGCKTYQLAFWGLYNLMKTCESYGIIKDTSSITEDFFGFYMAPMFNSVKRMEDDVTNTFGVFFTNQSLMCVDTLYNLNLKRKLVVQQKLEALSSIAQPYAPYIYLTDAASGMVGLIAGKIMETTGEPVFVLHDEGPNCDGNRYKGSGRCPVWFDAKGSVGDIAAIAGHDSAFGVGVRNETDLKRMFRVLCQDVPAARAKADVEAWVPDYVIATDWSADCGIDVGCFSEFLIELENYRPFGKGFPAPMGEFRFRNGDVLQWNQIGRAKEHLKISFANGFDVLCWGQGNMISEKDEDVEHVVIGSLGRSVYKGNMQLNFSGTIQKSGTKA